MSSKTPSKSNLSSKLEAASASAPASASTCVLCDASIPKSPKNALNPDSDSLNFLKCLKLLSMSCTVPLLESPVNISKTVTFLSSPYLLFCSSCRTQLIQLGKISTDLESLVAQFSIVREEARKKLLQSTPGRRKNVNKNVNQLRRTIIQELDLINTSKPHGFIIAALEDEDVRDVSYMEFPDPEPELANQSSQEINPSEPEPSVPAQLNNLQTDCQPCSVYLGKRIDELIPIPNCQTQNIIVPKELLLLEEETWTGSRAISSSIYEGDFPKPCPIEGCKSKIAFNNKWGFRRHLIDVHIKHRLKQSTTTNSIYSTYTKILWEPPLLLKSELDSFTYPMYCPRPECAQDVVTHYQDKESLLAHFGKAHICKPKRRKTSSELIKRHGKTGRITTDQTKVPDQQLSDQLDKINYPTPCPLKETKNCPSPLQYENHSQLHHHLNQIHNIYWIPKKLKITPGGTPRKSRPCPYAQCSGIFSNEYKLKKHIEQTHGPPDQITCPHCGKVSANSASLQLHLLTHNMGTPKWKCSGAKCSLGFLKPTDRTNHERPKHWEELGLEPLQCTICTKDFASIKSLKNHMNTHAGVFKYPCSWEGCQFKTQVKATLDDHIAKAHIQEFPYMCEVCGKKYNTNKVFREHVKRHKDKGHQVS